MNAWPRFKAASLVLALLAPGCSDDDGGLTAAPVVMTITTPTSQSTFATTESGVIIGGTLTGLQVEDLFPGAMGRVDNLTTGRLVTIRLEGTGAWRTTSPVPLAFGINQIHAFVDVRSGSADDSITITRN